jgi:hypothetical protein
VVRVGAYEAAVWGHDLDRGHAVGGQPVAARQPAHAAADGVPRHAHVGRCPRERDQAVLAGGSNYILPLGARLGTREAYRGVYVHAPHPRSLEQHRALQLLERQRPVARALRCDTHPLHAGEAHRPDHINSGLGEHHNCRPLIDREIPRAARVVIALVARNKDITGDHGDQRFDAGTGDCVRGTHHSSWSI